MRGPLNDCNCCQGLTAQTPADVTNRPGLSAIAYRVGTQSRFKQSMLAALSDTGRPALQSLKTRDDDDFSIALLDAVATMADVLTFYQERIANESYLRTATERRSLLELARLIGYELRPGVAASTFLVFTMDTSQGAPQTTTVDIGTKVQSIPGPNQTAQTFETVEPIQTFVAWNALTPQMTQPQKISSGLKELFLSGTNTQLHPGDAILIVGNERIINKGSERWDFRIVQTVDPDSANNRTHLTWQEGLGHVAPPMPPATTDVKVYALRQRAGLFGNNAPDPRLLSSNGTQLTDLVTTDSSGQTIWKNFSLNAAQIDLDTTYPKILLDSWIILVSPTYVELCRVNSLQNVSRADFALSAKVTRIGPDILENSSQFDLRNTLVFAQSELLDMSEQPITDPISGAAIPLAQAPAGLVKGQWLAASGKDGAGTAISEIVQIAEIDDATLTVTPPLANSYARDGFSFNANVAHATHGETVTEILGSGDASQTFQQFALKQSPLTYVSAANANGAASTLQVRVNSLLWQEVPTLFGRGTQEHIFVTRRDDNSVTTVEFGDGVSGACLPTGQNNVQAVYRKGIGLGGLVSAGQLTSLLTRPLGINSVTNPEDTTGAQDPESLADARTNTPLTVMTLDRAVSLEDYEDFSRAFAGIAKAMATWIWANQTRRVFVTVAGPEGAEIKTDSDTYKYLLTALQQAGDPFVSLCVKSFQPAFFHFAGKVKIDPAYETDSVLAAVEQALRTQFSFDARDFGEPVFLSEVFAVVQAVPGVVALDVNKLYRADKAPTLEARLLAALPEMLSDGSFSAAELLTLDPAPLDELGVMS